MNTASEKMISREVKTSILGRAKCLWIEPGKETRIRRAERSFAISYLLDPNTEATLHSLDVELTKYALIIAFDEGLDAAEKFINEIDVTADKGLVGRIIKGITSQSKEHPKSASLFDRYLYPTSLQQDEQNQVRECYQSIFDEWRIDLPLDEPQMLKMLASPAKEIATNKPHDFDQTKELIWSFIHHFWPLFDASTLKVPLFYFDLRRSFSLSEILRDFASAEMFGLEQILARQVALRAVWGHEADKQAFQKRQISLAAKLSPDTEGALQSFFSQGSSSSVSFEDLLENNQSPLERAINLSVYLYEREDSLDLLSRLVRVYEIDPAMFKIVNWTAVWPDVDDSSYYRSPELVFLASSLALSGALDDFEHERADYLPTGATTDLESYARYCSSEHSMTTHRFFGSFMKLPPNARKVVFRYLLRPGVIDNIVNVFPTIAVPMKETRHKEAVNTLTTKLDCIRFVRTKNILSVSEIRPIERECRRLLRHTYFEASASEGRIRVSRKQLAAAISCHVAEEVESQLRLVDDLSISGRSLRNAIIDRRLELCAESTASWICFECRYAFDYLLSNLRHNFIRFKIESSIDEVFEGSVIDRDKLKIGISGTIDKFNYQWLTIDPERSFYENLKGLILTELREDYFAEKIESLLAERIASIALDEFRDLLTKCRQSWISGYLDECLLELIDLLEDQGVKIDSVLEDRLGHSMTKVFGESAEWMRINEENTAKDFGLKELCEFEAAVFSTAKTRTPEFSVACYEGQKRISNLSGSDVLIKGEHFDRFCILIQNMLENAYGNSHLPVSDTEIEVSIIRGDDDIRIEFRNRFKHDSRSRIEGDVVAFNEAARRASIEVKEAPIETGGSGIRRIVYEFFPVSAGVFKIHASPDELSKGTFLATCIFPRELELNEDPDN